jgi:hypothetical protein
VAVSAKYDKDEASNLAMEDAFKKMSPWCRSQMMKAFFLTGYEGAFTSHDYDTMGEDERDFFLTYISEVMKRRKDSTEPR